MVKNSRCSEIGARWARSLAATSALALVFGAAPAALDLDADGLSLVSSAALAKNDGDNGNGGGNGNGGDNGNAGGNAGAAPGAAKAANTGKAAAPGQAKKDGAAGGNVAYVFSKKEADALLAKGWAQVPDGYKNHGQFVSTYVHIAKALGYSARDGALQANFMSLAWYQLQADLRALELRLATAPPGADIAPLQLAVDNLKSELDGMAAAIPDWKPGNGPQGDEWATVNLDANGDGVVNEDDVAWVEAGNEPVQLYQP